MTNALAYYSAVLIKGLEQTTAHDWNQPFNGMHVVSFSFLLYLFALLCMPASACVHVCVFVHVCVCVCVSFFHFPVALMAMLYPHNQMNIDGDYQSVTFLTCAL